MKVLIVTPCGRLPVPATKGGAIQDLVESLVRQNQIENKLKLSIVSPFEEEAARKAQVYSSTEFIYLHKSRFIEKTDDVINKCIAIAKGKRATEKKRYYLWMLYVIMKLVKLLSSERYDAVVFENRGYFLNIFRSGRLLRKYDGRIFLRLHNKTYYYGYKKALKKTSILLISEYMKRVLCEDLGKEFEKNSYIFRNGFNADKFKTVLSSAEYKEIRESFGIGEFDKVIIFVGRITAIKGVYELTEAFNKIDKERIKLLVLGSSLFGLDVTSSFEKKMKEIFEKERDRIIFTGYVPNSEIWKYYKIADIAVLPTVGEEAAGLAMLEAQSAGLPLITTRSGGIPEYVDHESSILLENDGELVNNLVSAIYEVIDNYSFWKKRAESSRDFITENYSESKYYNEFIEILSNCIHVKENETR